MKPIHRKSDNELLGYVRQNGESWDVLTMFCVRFDVATSEKGAVSVLQNKGFEVLSRRWEYFDQAGEEWQPCVLKEAREGSVTIITTNEYGHQEPGVSKQLTFNKPDGNVLRLA